MLIADDLERLFSKAAKLGCGIELNLFDINFAEIDEDALSVLRIYKIAKNVAVSFILEAMHIIRVILITRRCFLKEPLICWN